MNEKWRDRIAVALFIFVVGLGLYAAFQPMVEAQPAGYVASVVIASGIDADGTFTTVTLSKTSYDCTFINRDGTATNTTDLTINGSASAIRLYGGDVYNTNVGPVPISVSTFAAAAVVGTPDIQYFCWGRPAL